MVNEFRCPLCNQPVSISLYRKITGVWEERQKILKELKERRIKLKEEKKKLLSDFNKRKNELINKAIKKEKRQFDAKLEKIKLKEDLTKKAFDKKLEKTIELAHKEAEREQKKAFEKERIKLKDSLREEAQEAVKKQLDRIDKQKSYIRNYLDQIKSLKGGLSDKDRRIRELELELKRQTTPQIEGLLYEGTLINQLKKMFGSEGDKFEHTGKGGDIVHHIILNGIEIGIIVYECKRVKKWDKGYLTQTLRAKEKRRADYGILVTNAMKKGTQGFFIEKGIIIVHPAGVLALVGMLREQIKKITRMKLGQKERDEAIRLTLEYIEGPEFNNSLGALINESKTLYDELKSEINTHFSLWEKRYDHYKHIYEQSKLIENTTKIRLTGKKEPPKKEEGFPLLGLGTRSS